MLDGGLVKDAIPFPLSHNQFAVSGVWSGGNWNAREKFIARHFRNRILIGIWQVVGVDKIAHKDAVAILSPEGNPHPIRSGDILVFGEGTYKIFSVMHTDLPIDTDRAVEVGISRYHGIAVFEKGMVTKIICFSASRGTIENTTTLPVWWRGYKYSFMVKPDIESGTEELALILKNLLQAIETLPQKIKEAVKEEEAEKAITSNPDDSNVLYDIELSNDILLKGFPGIIRQDDSTYSNVYDFNYYKKKKGGTPNARERQISVG